jgi:hypothetical protein
MIDFEIFSLYFFAIASFVCIALSLHLAFKFKKTKQFTSLIIISLSFLFDFVANMIYLIKYYFYTSSDLIPYPGIEDYLWIMSYLFFGLGSMMYSFLIKRLINKKKAIKDVYLITLSTVFAFIISYPLLNALGALSDFVFDPLYFAVPFFASIACIPIYYLFKGGKISTAWKDFALGGFCYMIGEILFLLKDLTFSVSDIFYSLAYLFFIKAFYNLVIKK